MSSTRLLSSSFEAFLTQLRQSQLFDWTELESVTADARRERVDRSADSIADWLVAQGRLTRFQADKVLACRTQDLVTGPYILKEIIGTGAMGTVYRATRRPDGGDFTIKLIPRRSMWKVVKARRYVRTFERIHHPAVARFVDVGTHGNHHYLVWSFVEGETLRQRVEREGPLPFGEAARLTAAAADGVAACHEHNLNHGVLSPANFLLATDGTIRVLDAGIGALLADNSTGEALLHTLGHADQLVRGLDCASPEAILDPEQVTSSSDQYSLGCVVYYLLTGRFPFEGGAVVKMQAHQTEVAPPADIVNPFVPRGLAAVVERMMQKSPADRYPDIGEAAAELRRFADRPVGPNRRSKSSGISVIPTSASPNLPVAEPVVSEPLDRPPSANPFDNGGREDEFVSGGVNATSFAILMGGIALGLLGAWIMR